MENHENFNFLGFEPTFNRFNCFKFLSYLTIINLILLHNKTFHIISKMIKEIFQEKS